MFHLYYTPLMWFFLLSIMICLGLAWYAWQQTPSKLNRAFSAMMLAAAWWALADMLEVMGADAETTLFWMKVKYLGVVSMAPLWLVLAIYYVRRPQWLKYWFVRAIIAIELSLVIFVFTNDKHHLWWSSMDFVTTSWGRDFQVEWGPAFWLHAALSYSMLFAVVLIFLSFYWNVSKLHRHQIELLLLALMIPLLSNLSLVTKGVPSSLRSLDITPFPMMLSGILIGYALFRYQLFAVAPMARDVIFEQTEDGIMILDEENCIVDINFAALQLLNYPDKGVVGQHVSKLRMVPALAHCLSRWLDPDVELPLQCMIEFPKKDKTCYLQITISAITEPIVDSAERRCIVTLHDITEHREFQAIMRRYVRMMAHDVRSPLALAIGYLSLIEESPLDKETHEYLHIVQHALRRIDTLTAKLLDLERLRAGVGLQPKIFSPAEAARLAYKDIAPLAEAKNQVFQLDVASNLPDIYGDPLLIRQALVNLGTNAIKYTLPAGSIRIEVRQNAENILFNVIDNGPGIAPERQAHLFEPFQQDKTTTEHGTGLGLSLVKAIVEAHHGSVHVQSTLGQGSTFQFILPLSHSLET
ncbi:MAG: PAS domain-containing protein [Chloroflexi bacterium]|nr:PAS domain-containing protein [Chloroflexota bacterium]